MAPLISRKWGSMVELEELTSEQQNSDFDETEYIGWVCYRMLYMKGELLGCVHLYDPF